MPPKGSLGYRYVDPYADAPRSVEGSLSIWRGPVLPFARLDGGRLRSGGLQDVIRSSLITILGTPLGSVFHSPDFGSYLAEILFEPSDPTTQALLKSYTRQAIEKWEKRVGVIEVEVMLSDNNVDILISYYIKDSGAVDQLALSAARFVPGGLIEVRPSTPAFF